MRRDFYFQSITAEQGLAQNTVSAFLQDHSGFIWIGTDSGLQQYDGYGFNTYLHSSDDPDSAPQGPVSALAEDADGNIWIGTDAFGLVRHSPSTGVFERMPRNRAVIPTGSAHIQALLFDARQGLWVGSRTGIALVDTSDGHSLRSLSFGGDSDNDRATRVRQLRLGADGTLWAATSTGLWRLAPHASALEHVDANQIASAFALLVERGGQLAVAASDGVYHFTTNGTAERIWPLDGDQMVNAMAQDHHGRLWLAVPHQGLALVDTVSGQTQWLKPVSGLAGSLPDAIVTHLAIDPSGLLWIGTFERGLIKVDPEGTPFQYIYDSGAARGQTGANYLRAVFEDHTGALWLGTEGDGPKRYLPKENRFDYFKGLLAQPSTDAGRGEHLVVSAFIGVANDDRMWIATNHGAGLFDPSHRTLSLLPDDATGAHGMPDTDVRCALRAEDGNLWFGTMRGGLERYNPADDSWLNFRAEAAPGTVGGLSDDSVIALYEDHDGNIWSGNLTGLNLIDAARRSVRVFRNDPRDAHSLPADTVRALHATDDHTLWVGTQAGFARLDAIDAKGAHFTRWLPRDGLPNGTVYAIADDDMGRLWLSTNRGIVSFDRTTEVFRSFTLLNGLQGMEFNGGVVAQLRDGRIAFGGVNGLNLFSPQAIVGSRYAAPVVFTKVRIGNKGAHVPRDGGKLSMTSADRIIHFEFAALDFTEPERNHFAYQLQGFDKRWVDAGARHEATYTNLDPGTYTFKVRASNHDGYWNDRVATIALRVIPPWWNSLAAKTLYALLAMLALLLLWRAQQGRRREEQSYHHDLQEREDRLRLALWGSGDDFWDWHFGRQEIFVTGSGDLFKGASMQPMVLAESWFSEHLHPEDLPTLENRVQQHVQRVTETFESEHRLRNHRGEWVWSHTRGKIVERDREGLPLRMCGTARDVTATRAAERERRIAHEVIRSMAEAVAVSDLDFRFLTVNPAFTRMTGWRQDEVAGHSAALLNCARHAADYYLEMRDALARDGHWHGELWQLRKDGEEFLSWIELSEVRDANDVRTHFVGVLSDITQRKRAEQELRYLANYDALTGLPNRTLLSERMGHAIIRARRASRKLAVLFLDLDRFKHVNDSMGHATGDRMLKAAGNRLRQVVREGDSVARFGGDEFTIVLEDVVSSAEAEHVAQKVIAAFEQPLELDNGQEIVISPSIGISLYPDHGNAPTDLLKFADTAMYQAKDHGRKTYMVYTEAMDAAARLRATMVAALGKALERNELSLVYQPKLSLFDDRITGVEALLRWRSDDLGNVSPGVFIPIAEETGLIVEIGAWVVAQACAQLARWRDEGIGDLSMSINVSVAQLLRGDLIQHLCGVLAEHEIVPNQIELELTESMVMANAELSITTLRRLKAVGVMLAIDDFGTGYSSLSYLKRLPIDALKIDKAFVGDITTDPDDEAITATVIMMAHSLGLNVVAEGVEHREQVDYLREQGCDEVQGHWLAFPLPPDRCLAFLREHREAALNMPPG